MTDIRNAKLVLRTSAFTSNANYILGQSYSSPNGFINGKCSSITWNNINLRSLLGDMYEKYNSFNLCLNTISTSTSNILDTNQECKNVVMRMTGLNWLNQTYSTSTLTSSSKATIGTISFSPLYSTTQSYYSNSVTFGKNSEIVNLTIEYSRVADDAMSTSVFTLGITNITVTALINTNTLTLSAANAYIVVGSTVSGNASIPAGSYVTGFISSTSITISNNVTAAINNGACVITPLATYPNAVFIFDIYGIPNDGALREQITFN